MVVYILLAIFFYKKYLQGKKEKEELDSKINTLSKMKESNDNNKENDNDKEIESLKLKTINPKFLKLLIISTVYFIIAASISFIEFLMKKQSNVGNVILIIIGSIIIVYIYKMEKYEAKKYNYFDKEKDDLRKELLHLPRNSVKKYLEENKVKNIEIKEKNILFHNEENEIPK